MMRTRNSMLNAIANVGVLLIQTVLVFIVRIIFTKTLNAEYLGIQGLFTNIITMLSLAELGIGNAISFSLYKHLANNDTEKISSTVTLLKKVYFGFAIFVLVVGMIMLPFLKYLVTDYHMGNLSLIFIIYLVTLIFEFVTAYPEILITADQKRYKIAYLNLLYLILVNVFQIIILLWTKNFIYYLIVDLVLKTTKYIITNIYIRKTYKQINFSSKKSLNKNEKTTLLKNVKSLFVCKIGEFLVNGTDNIIISKFINVATTGLYSNYLSIAYILKNIVNNFMIGITSSFGNLIVNETKETQKNVFDIMNFITFLCANYMFICLLFLLSPFINLCFGSDYLLSFSNVLIICINFYLITIILPVDTVKSAAGLYYEDRYISIIQAIINLILSIVLAIKYGLIGVLLGTMFSYLLTVSWEKPFIVYKKVFGTNCREYIVTVLKNIILVSVLSFLFYLVFDKLNITISLVNFIIMGLLITLVYWSLIIVLLHKKKEFKYLVNMIRGKIYGKKETSSN